MKMKMKNLITMTTAVAMLGTTVAYSQYIEIPVQDPATIDLMEGTPAMDPNVVAPLDSDTTATIMQGDVMAINNDAFYAPAANPDLVPPVDGEVEMPMLDAIGGIAPFVSETGTVGMLEEAEEDGSFAIFMENENGGLRFMVSPETRILDRETGEYIFAEDVTEGMAITVIYSATAPMGMSLPPFIGQIAGLVVNTDLGSVAVGQFDSELYSLDADLQINIDEENTLMGYLNGARMPLNEEVIKNNGTAIVFYDMTTRSIPPQTTPTHVFFIEEEVMIGEAGIGAELGLAPLDASSSVEDDVVNPETGLPDGWTPAQGARPIEKEINFVPVRATAEALGYEVIWQGSDAPVIVQKDGVVLEIIMGSSIYLENGFEVEAPEVAENVHGTLFAAINF